MTRENKPVIIVTISKYKEEKPKERVLDDWIKPFVDSVNERFKREDK